jgi:FG-GAP repeat
VIIGAFGASPNGIFAAGSSYVVFGRASGFAATIALADLDGKNGFRLDGDEKFGSSGYSVADAGDVNHDGVADVIIGAPQARPNGSDSGQSYLVFGRP